MSKSNKSFSFCSTFLVLVLTLVFIVKSSGVVLAVEAVKDYKVTAVYVFKLVSYIDIGRDQKVLCTVGDDPVNSVLQELTKNNGIKFFPNTGINDIDKCGILYISPYSQVSDSFISKLSNLPILTISDIRGFANMGGVVGLEWNEEGKMKLKINTKIAKKNNMKVSSDLLAIAEVVQ